MRRQVLNCVRYDHFNLLVNNPLMCHNWSLLALTVQYFPPVAEREWDLHWLHQSSDGTMQTDHCAVFPEPGEVCSRQ